LIEISKDDRELGRFAILLAALAAFMCLVPFVSEKGIGLIALRIGTTLLMAAAAYSVSERRWQLVVAVILATPSFISHSLDPYLGEQTALSIRMGMSSALFFYIAVLISIFLLKQQRVSADMVLGAINVYLLAAIAFAFLHAFMEVLKPGAYLYRDESISAVLKGHPEVHALAFLLYFSVVTLTTLGYGDMSPAIPGARMLCSLEAVIGQLFVAVFIARLVSLHVGSRKH
jgi:voltage-gated potassium channel